MKVLLILGLLGASAVAETRAEPPPSAPGLYGILTTSMGSIKVKLLEKEAPETVGSFVALASGTRSWKDPRTGAGVLRPLYRNLAFNRVIAGYVIQTGDPTNTGSYDCGVRVKDEPGPALRFDQPGRVGILNMGQPDTGGCQFFITDDAYPALDASPGNHGYTIFGQVVEGQEIVDRISHVPADAKGRPRTAVMLMSVTIERIGPGPAPPVPVAPPSAPRRTVGSRKVPDFN